MTIFQLFLYSCVSITDLYGDLVEKTCRWDARDHFTSELLCEAAGAAQIGQPVFSDVMEQRTVEKSRCAPVSVTQDNNR